MKNETKPQKTEEIDKIRFIRKKKIKAHEITFILDEDKMKSETRFVALRLTNMYGQPYANLPSFNLPMATFKRLLQYRGGVEGNVFKDLENAVKKSIRNSTTILKPRQ